MQLAYRYGITSVLDEDHTNATTLDDRLVRPIYCRSPCVGIGKQDYCPHGLPTGRRAMCGTGQAKTQLIHTEGCLCPVACLCQWQVQVAGPYPGDVLTIVVVGACPGDRTIRNASGVTGTAGPVALVGLRNLGRLRTLGPLGPLRP